MAKEDVPKPVRPQQRYAEALVRVERVEAVLKVLGEEDTDAEPLKALKQARIHAHCQGQESSDTSRSESSWPTLAKPTLAKTDFGQTEFDVWCCVFVCLCVCVCVLCGVGVGFTVSWCGVSRVGVGFKVLVWSCSVPQDRPSREPAKVGLAKFGLIRMAKVGLAKVCFDRSETPWKSRGRMRRSWQRVAGSGGFASDSPRPECPKSGDGGGTQRGNHQIEGASGRALGSTRDAPRRRVIAPRKREQRLAQISCPFQVDRVHKISCRR